MMQIGFDPDKRKETLTKRGLDFARADEIFAGVNVTAEDARFDYGEPRFITVGVFGWANGRRGLDAARQGTPHHQHEESQ